MLGAETRSSTTHPRDEVIKIRPFAPDYFEIKRYYSILGDWIYRRYVTGIDHGFGY